MKRHVNRIADFLLADEADDLPVPLPDDRDDSFWQCGFQGRGGDASALYKFGQLYT